MRNADFIQFTYMSAQHSRVDLVPINEITHTFESIFFLALRDRSFVIRLPMRCGGLRILSLCAYLIVPILMASVYSALSLAGTLILVRFHRK